MLSLIDIGAGGVFALVGLYLLVVMIMGKFFPIWKGFPPAIPIRYVAQRIALGFLGGVLFVPPVWVTSFGPLFAGDMEGHKVNEDSTTTQPVQNEEGKTSRGQSPTLSRLPLGFAYNLSPHIVKAERYPPGGGCRRLESFGLEQEHIVPLEHSRFDGQVYVYVEDIHNNPMLKPFNVHVVSARRGAFAKNQKIGEEYFPQQIRRVDAETLETLRAVQHKNSAIDFRYEQRSYRLTVTRIHNILFGSDRISVEVCVLP